jgi:hypothetical protein
MREQFALADTGERDDERQLSRAGCCRANEHVLPGNHHDRSPRHPHARVSDREVDRLGKGSPSLNREGGDLLIRKLSGTFRRRDEVLAEIGSPVDHAGLERITDEAVKPRLHVGSCFLALRSTA